MPVKVTNDFDSAWDGVVAPWFAQNKCCFLEGDAPAVVLVPSLSYAQALRARLALDKTAFAGIHFWVPGDARRFLSGVFPDVTPAADRETMLLVLGVAAQSVFDENPDFLSAKVVAAQPESLLESFERLSCGGWGYEELGDEQLNAIGRKFEQRLAELNLCPVPKCDFDIARRLREGEFGGKPIRSLLLLGFSGAHWGQWPTLEAIARLTEDATICIRPMRNDGVGFESAWMGTWENLLGTAEVVQSAKLIQDRPSYRYAEAVWAGISTPSVSTETGAVSFVPASGIAAEARASVLQAIEYLGKRGSKRVGILVPGPGALAREIAASLEAVKMPFWNDLGTPEPGFFEQTQWKSLMDFLQSPTTESFLSTIASGAKPEGLPLASHEEIETLFRKSRVKAFLEEFDLLSKHLAMYGEGKAAELGRFLVGLPRLTCSASFGDLRHVFEEVLKVWGWSSVSGHVFDGSAESDLLKDVRVSRETFLGWIANRAKTASRAQGEFGSHPYARLVLSTYQKADGLRWDHLVLTGLNEGSYPPPYADAVFLGEDTIFSLNERVRKLNESSTQVVPGLGECVVPGKSMMLGPVEERWACQQAFVNALEETTGSVAALISVVDEMDGSRELRPSEFFTRMFEADYGRAPSAGELRKAAQDFHGTETPSEPVHAVRSAFDVRRDRMTPFNEYSFCFREDEPREVRLGASGWESVFEYPAEQWCRGAIGLSLGREDNDMPWKLTIGEWAHGWLATAGGTNGVVVNSRPAGHFRRSVELASDLHIEKSRAFFTSLGRELPRWWSAAFEDARLRARKLADSLDLISTTAWPSFVCEACLPKNSGVTLPGGRLHLYGRFDIVFFDRTGEDLPSLLKNGASVWLLDFKSGKNKPLTGKGLAQGEGIQLGLYGLALHDAGSSDAGLTLLKPGAEATMQVTLAEVKGQTALLDRILRLQKSGRFGLLESLRNEFRPGASFPLATLAIPLATLLAKNALTHPDLEPSAS